MKLKGIFSGWFTVLRRMRESDSNGLIIALGMTLVVGLTEGLSIGLLIPLITLVEPGSATLAVPVPGSIASWLGSSEIRLHVGLVLALLIVLVMLRSLFQRSSDLKMAELINAFARRTRQTTFDTVSRAKWSVLAVQRIADLQHNLTAEVDRLQGLAFSSIAATKAAIIGGVYLCVAVLISPVLTLLALSFSGLIFLIQMPLHRKVRAIGQCSLDIRTEQTRTISDFLSSIKVNKAFSLEREYSGILERSMARLDRTVRDYVNLQGQANLTVQTGMVTGLSLFVYASLVLVETTQAEVLILLVLFFRLSGRTLAIQGALREIDANVSTLRRLDEMVDRYSKEEEDAFAPAEPVSLHRELRFADVSLTYSGATRPALDAVSLVLPARKLTALVGRTGSGKTTIADLALGLLSPDSGRITIDEMPLDDRHRRAWRQAVSLVPQDPVLFHGTIRENLLLVQPDATKGELEQALETAQLLPLVERLPKGLDSQVGDRGQLLSGGERQRLALARALLKKPALLVLDEATSALDSATEAEVVGSLVRLSSQMTVLAITHRPALLDVADHVVLIRGGRIVSEGANTRSLGPMYAVG